ncbi:MAG: glycosyltransferase [Bacteroidota bacterium]|nr:glycosyltransferase [Bacteroidota bacterium]
MKVLFTFGGLPHYLIPLLNKINATEGFEVVVVIPKGQSKTIGKGVKQDNKGIEFKVIHTDEYITYYRKPFLKNLKFILKEENPDIFITLWPYILGFVFYPSLLYFIKRSKIKFILREIPFCVPKQNEAFSYYKAHPIYDENLKFEKNRGMFFILKTSLLTFIRKRYYNFIDGSINYTNSAVEIQSSYGLKKDRIFVTYNSPDTDTLLMVKEEAKKEALLMKPCKYRIIHVGRLVPWKRVDLLIRSVAIVKDKYTETELLIIGNGPQKNDLLQLSTNLNINSSVIFVDGVYDSKLLVKYMMESTIYILAGMGGLSINEAMVVGKPIICSVCDGTEKDLVRENYNGLYFKEGDEISLAEKIKYLFDNPQIIEKMGRNSEKIIFEEININTVKQNFIDALNKIHNTF